MIDPGVAQLISSITSLVTAIGVLYGIYVSRGNRTKLDQHSATLQEVRGEVAEVAIKTNGLADKLAISSRHEGVMEGRAEGQEQARSDGHAEGVAAEKLQSGIYKLPPKT